MKFFLYFILFFFIDIKSHEFNPAHLVVDQLESEKFIYEANWMYPFKNIGKRGEVIFPKECRTKSSDLYYQGKYIKEKILLDCSKSLKGSSIEVINLSVLTDALITINFSNDDTFEGIVNNKNSIIEIPFKESYLPTAYIFLGVDHLLNGFDHILFIIGLMFLVVGTVNLIKTITAFTVAHSITLGLSVFELISVPQITVEILIALTIVYLGLEIRNSNKYEFTPWKLAFGFGLLHGLGFAGALTDIGIENDQILFSLLFFNIGIEIGQLLLIPFISLFIYIAHNLNFYKHSVSFSSYAVGSMGAYWAISRFINLF
tara:strand:+ start:177 stop:1124 length:948 start_codon:yes stop_codon:yes gene_type:complete